MHKFKITNHIAVFIPNKVFFGHLILQIPFFNHLKQKFPDSKIYVFSPVEQGAFFKKLDLCDEIFYYKKGGINFSTYRQLKRVNPDRIYNLRPYSFLIQIWISLFRKAFKTGFKSSFGSSWAYNVLKKYDNTIYKSLLYLTLLDKDLDQDRFRFFETTIKEPSYSEKNIITMMPGGGEGDHKKWGIENFLSTAELILTNIPDTRVVFILGPMEQYEIERIDQFHFKNKCTVLVSPNISTIQQIAKQSRLVLANDCGPSHIAQMTGCRYIGLWGWEKQHPIQRIAEWSYPSGNCVQLVSKYGESIKTIAPSKVYASILGMINSED